MCDRYAPEKPMFNPFHVAFNPNDLCISEADLEAIFEHDRGDDCIPEDCFIYEGEIVCAT